MAIRTNNFWPQVLADKIAFAFTVVAVHAVCLYELFVIMPYMVPTYGWEFLALFVCGLFFYLNIMFSLVSCITTDTTSGSVVLPSILLPNWRFCSSCESNAPPRSFHCWICQRCILTRDHHCTFTGNCIGHANRRYYLSLILYLSVGSLYCSVLHFDYSMKILGGFGFGTLLNMFLPLIAWILGIAESSSFPVAFFASLCLVSCLLVSSLLVYHMSTVIRGQTTHERSFAIYTYDFGWRQNLRETFGRNWFVYWVFPFLANKLPGDGISFKKIEQIKRI